MRRRRRTRRTWRSSVAEARRRVSSRVPSPSIWPLLISKIRESASWRNARLRGVHVSRTKDQSEKIVTCQIEAHAHASTRDAVDPTRRHHRCARSVPRRALHSARAAMRAFSRAKIAPRAPTFVSARLVARDVPPREDRARCPRTHSSFRPATAASGAADADAAPPVPTVTRAACPPGETEVVALRLPRRALFPGQGDRGPRSRRRAPRGGRDRRHHRRARGRGAGGRRRGCRALARARRSTTPPRPSSTSTRATIPARQDRTTPRRREPAYQSFVGWRRLEEDVVGFPPRATGLLVQLEDGLVADTVMIKPEVPATSRGKAADDAREGRARRGRAEADDDPTETRAAGSPPITSP